MAHDLIGTHLVRVLDNTRLVGRIVETEAYRGAQDAASHAYRGETTRNTPMFGEPGRTYVYFIYGMHWMFNISAHPDGVPGAILIRAVEPLEGLAPMRRNRGMQRDRDLTNGPAKLAQALAIDGTLNNVDLCTSDILYLTQGHLQPGEHITSGPRVRVPGDQDAKTRLWRFWLEGNVFVST